MKTSFRFLGGVFIATGIAICGTGTVILGTGVVVFGAMFIGVTLEDKV